jgi:hypothetical protein
MAKPVVTSIIICDNIYRDGVTKKCVLSGTFTKILSFKFPVTHGNLGLYVALTDISEAGKVQVLFRSEEDHDIVIPLPVWEINKIPEDRTETIELCGNLSGLTLPKEGKYEFAIFWNDVFIGAKRVGVIKLVPKSS